MQGNQRVIPSTLRDKKLILALITYCMSQSEFCRKHILYDDLGKPNDWYFYSRIYDSMVDEILYIDKTYGRNFG